MDNETWKFSGAIKGRGTNQCINKGLINKLGLTFFSSGAVLRSPGTRITGSDQGNPACNSFTVLKI